MWKKIWLVYNTLLTINIREMHILLRNPNLEPQSTLLKFQMYCKGKEKKKNHSFMFSFG